MPMSHVEVLRAACCVAGLDREICENEQPILEKLAERAGVGRASLNAMLDRAKEDPNFYQEQFRIARADPDTAIKTLFLVAIADHDLTLNERVILQHFAEKLGMTQQRFDELYAAAEKQVKRGEAQA